MTMAEERTADRSARGGGGRALAWVLLAVVLAAAVWFAVSADWTDEDTRSATAGLPDLGQELAAHQWLLDASASSPTPRSPNPVTLVFDDDSVSGRGPCNVYRGDLSVDDDAGEITISRIAATQRACDAEAERAEEAYFATLRRVRSVDLDDAYNARWLVLENDRGARLSFDAITAHDLLIGSWEITNVSRGDAIESPVAGTDPVIAFTADGDVTIEAGCNTIRGTFDLDGDRIDVGPLAQTMKACDPPEVMDQEAALAQALDSAVRVEVVPGELTILDDEDHIVIVATARPSRRTG